MSNETDEEVTSLIKELEQLQLRIGTVTNRLRDLQRKDTPINKTLSNRWTTEDNREVTKSRRNKREKDKDTYNDNSETKIKKYTYKKGDRILVKNPTSKQRVNIGTVNRHRRNGYVEFTLDDGEITCRAYKNVELISKA